MSDIASCHSLKSVALNLIAGEVGFLGVQPCHSEKTYNDFVRFQNAMKNKLKNEDFEDEYCSLTYSLAGKVVCVDFDVDFKKDITYLLGIFKMNNATLSLMPTVNSMAVTMCVNNIYKTIGDIMNTDDSYFEIIEAMWASLDKDYKHYDVLVEHKIEGLKRCLGLSDSRINQLLLLR